MDRLRDNSQSDTLTWHKTIQLWSNISSEGGWNTLMVVCLPCTHTHTRTHTRSAWQAELSLLWFWGGQLMTCNHIATLLTRLTGAGCSRTPQLPHSNTSVTLTCPAKSERWPREWTGTNFTACAGGIVVNRKPLQEKNKKVSDWKQQQGTNLIFFTLYQDSRYLN